MEYCQKFLIILPYPVYRVIFILLAPSQTVVSIKIVLPPPPQHQNLANNNNNNLFRNYLSVPSSCTS